MALALVNGLKTKGRVTLGRTTVCTPSADDCRDANGNIGPVANCRLVTAEILKGPSGPPKGGLMSRGNTFRWIIHYR